MVLVYGRLLIYRIVLIEETFITYSGFIETRDMHCVDGFKM